MNINQQLDKAIALAIGADVSKNKEDYTKLIRQLNSIRISIPKEIEIEARTLVIASMAASLDQAKTEMKNACRKGYTRQMFAQENKNA